MATVTVFTSAGSTLVTTLLVASTVKYIAWGVGGHVAAAVTQTALDDPSAEARTAGTQSHEQTDHADDTYRVTGTITCTSAGKAISEVGVFDASTDGNMFFRSTFDAVNVDVGDSIAFTISTKFDHSV